MLGAPDLGGTGPMGQRPRYVVDTAATAPWGGGKAGCEQGVLWAWWVRHVVGMVGKPYCGHTKNGAREYQSRAR